MAKRLQLVNEKFGRLEVKEFAGKNKHGQLLWKCECECGNIVIVLGCHLRSKHTASCGCVLKDIMSGKNNPMHKIDSYGENNPNYGNKWSIEARNKMSKKIKKLFSDYRNHPRYKPELTKEDRQDRRLCLGYRNWALSVYKLDNYSCQCCGRRKNGLNAHHIESYRDNPHLRIEISNGITLCNDCHKAFHKMFGYGKNTRAQLISFLRSYNAKI